MNVHDSEKVVGTLLARAMRRWRRRKRPAWCSTTPAASATRPSRRSSAACRSSSATRQGQDLRRAGLRGPAGRREDLRPRAARQPGVPARPAIPRFGEMLVQLEAGNRRVTGLEPGYRRDLRHAVHPPRQSAPRLHHHHRGLRQILRLLRGAVHARAGAQPHQRERHGGSARPGRTGLHRNPVAGPEREQLSRSLARRLGFRRAAGARGRDSRHPPRALHHLASARFRQAHRGRHGLQPGALRPRPSAGAVRLQPRCWPPWTGSTPATSTCGASSG